MYKLKQLICQPSDDFYRRLRNTNLILVNGICENERIKSCPVMPVIPQIRRDRESENETHVHDDVGIKIIATLAISPVYTRRVSAVELGIVES